MAAPERDPPQEEEEGEGGDEGPQEVGDPPQEVGDPPPDLGDPPPERRVVPGVLYLASLPPNFGPRHARALLAPHGELGRVFLQPRGGGVRRRRRGPGPPGGVQFAEGWVEFRDKRAAKRAAAVLQGAPMGARPRSTFRHHRWSLKYLPGFRWPHLSERLSYERQVRATRLRAEVAQAKREGGFHSRPPPKPTIPTGGTPKSPGDPPAPPRPWAFTQRPTEEEIWGRRARPPPAAPPRRLLRKIFGGVG